MKKVFFNPSALLHFHPILVADQREPLSFASREEETQALVQATHTTAMQAFEQTFNLFAHFHSLAKKTREGTTSIQYGQLVKKVESILLQAKNLVAKDPTISPPHIIEEMEKQFEELCTNMPVGKSVLLQKDVDKLKSLGKVSINKTYRYKEKEYYEPRVSLLEIAGYFVDFMEANGYASIAVSMKRDIYYHICKEKTFTLVGFRKKKSFFSSFPLLSKSKFSEQQKISKQLDQLRRLINEKISSWGYEGFTIFHMDEVKHLLTQADKDEWGSSIFLYHRKMGNEDLAFYEEVIPYENPYIEEEKKVNGLPRLTRKRLEVPEIRPILDVNFEKKRKFFGMRAFFNNYLLFIFIAIRKFFSRCSKIAHNQISRLIKALYTLVNCCRGKHKKKLPLL
ncbi:MULTISPECIES: hypothetical protein [unclassified Neochlamydia]|uniref:hypothetical protein n=1 Tax=unclassified Neochlamydia TaxID=2643326 RepID=UPI00140997CF|nr:MULTISPECIES: hypothetical protein [unclassified Neochlamydia]MBS4167163.1 hypothetical protein [Neochlamydia sp. AcF65]MBS4169479.1 hypothetical protein [Neochlamydia sp. AcF95]NGY95237.1 hypothetical protein [Neochlamydia sp. AcF84]